MEVLRASLPRRGANGRDDLLFLEALYYFSAHNITRRALRVRFAKWNRVWKRFDRLSKVGVFEAFFDHLAQFGPDVDSRAAVGHKGYARKAIGKQPANVALFPISRIKANERDKAAFFAKTIYKGRARIEQAVGKLKRFKRVALRCEKTRRNFESLVTIVAAFILVKSVHTA